MGCGQCVDDYGMGEAYRPLLEALGRLCRDAEGDRFVAALREHAPSWLAHLPSVLDPADRAALVRTTDGVTPAQMLRELTDALEAFTVRRPLVLVLEDLHWSDRATLAWLAYMARKRDSARILILGTYRPHEVRGRAHPLRALLADLRPHAQCAELVLDALSAPAVATYLSNRCGGSLPARVPAAHSPSHRWTPVVPGLNGRRAGARQACSTASAMLEPPGSSWQRSATSSPPICASTSSSTLNACLGRIRRCLMRRVLRG